MRLGDRLQHKKTGKVYQYAGMTRYDGKLIGCRAINDGFRVTYGRLVWIERDKLEFPAPL